MESFSGDDIINPFLSGVSGIWRSYKVYTFVGPRKSSANVNGTGAESDPRLFEDGVFTDAVPMFTWDLGNLEDYASTNPYKNWEWVSEITRFSSNSSELENVSRLNVYTSALFGYDNSLSIAIGGNAAYHEIGVMDFENLDPTQPYIFGKSMAQNNLNFYNNATGRPAKMLMSEHANFYTASYNSSGNLTMSFKFPNATLASEFINALPTSSNAGANQNISDGYENTFGLSLVSKGSSTVKGNESYYLNATYVYGTGQISGSDPTIVTCDMKPYMCTPGDVLHYLPVTSSYFGKLNMLRKRTVYGSVEIGNIGFTPTSSDKKKAHTGKQTMKVIGSTIFDQPKIKVLNDKSYVLSMWISRANTDVSTYKATSLIQACMMDVNGNAFLEIPNSVVTYGKVIEGWQKVEIEFKISCTDPAYTNYLKKIFGIRINPGASALYVDDVRFAPKIGGLSSSVYDNKTYWLSAVLNVDNYATFFYYNEQGSLTLKKQETEKGIFTISESRGSLQH